MAATSTVRPSTTAETVRLGDVEMEDQVLPEENHGSWTGALAGAAVGMVFNVWLCMLGVAIGASTVDPLQEARPLEGLGVGSAVWLSLSIVISSFLGGWIAARWRLWQSRTERLLSAAASWAVTNIVAMLLVGGVFGALLGGAATLSRETARMAGPDATANLAENVRTTLQVGEGADARTRRAGDTAAKAVAGTSWTVVILMFLGLAASLGGAMVAMPNALRSGMRSQP